jgi:hypothetical protein
VSLATTLFRHDPGSCLCVPTTINLANIAISTNTAQREVLPIQFPASRRATPNSSDASLLGSRPSNRSTTKRRRLVRPRCRTPAGAYASSQLWPPCRSPMGRSQPSIPIFRLRGKGMERRSSRGSTPGLFGSRRLPGSPRRVGQTSRPGGQEGGCLSDSREPQLADICAHFVRGPLACYGWLSATASSPRARRTGRSQRYGICMD